MYAKIPKDRADGLGIGRGRKLLPDGYILVNESDLFTACVEGESFEAKVTGLGGAVLTNVEAKQELDKIRKS